MNDELQRILALPRRPVIDCERVVGTRSWAPAVRSFVEAVTMRYARPPRLMCGCRDRIVTALPGGRLLFFEQTAPGVDPLPPIELALDAFLNDTDTETSRMVSALKEGQETKIGLGHMFCITELNPMQAWILDELPQAGGAFGLISVGGGKTIAGILASLSMSHLKTWVLMIKPDQRTHYRRAYLQLREHFRVPSIVFDDGGSYIVPGAPVVHVVPYSLLQNTKSTTLLESLNPDAFIGDEIHCLSNVKSTRTMRWLRYMVKNNGRVFAGWTGSPIDKSIKNCAHLIMHALGTGSPYPIKSKTVEDWAAVIDPSPTPDRTSPTAKALHKAFGKGDGKGFSSGFFSDDGVREGFCERVIQTPGIISTKSSSITCSLVIKERKAPKMPPSVREVLMKARQGLRVDDVEFSEQAEEALGIRAAAVGYYYYWAFPHSKPEDRIPGGTIDRWYAARKLWNKEVRVKLQDGEPHLDSAKLCENAAVRAYQEPRYTGDLPVWPALSWPAWRDIKDKVEPDERWKFIDDYLVRDAAEWIKENKGIVWCRRPFGMKLSELTGLPYHGGGPGAEERILAEDGSRSIIASIKAHSEGRDGLQYRFSKQIIYEMMPSGKGIEQLLGRLCRQGQKAETVETEICMVCSESRDDLRKALALAEFIEATTPNRQLIKMADLDIDL